MWLQGEKGGREHAQGRGEGKQSEGLEGVEGWLDGREAKATHDYTLPSRSQNRTNREGSEPNGKQKGECGESPRGVSSPKGSNATRSKRVTHICARVAKNGQVVSPLQAFLLLPGTLSSFKCGILSEQ